MRYPANKTPQNVANSNSSADVFFFSKNPFAHSKSVWEAVPKFLLGWFLVGYSSKGLAVEVSVVGSCCVGFLF
jgi:hypothetical protein